VQHKARNLLKRVGKMEVSMHDGEDFEKANLLLAKFYIDKVSAACERRKGIIKEYYMLAVVRVRAQWNFRLDRALSLHVPHRCHPYFATE
jgi:hypothetical protein